MKIAININELTLKQETGVKVYTREIVSALGKIDRENDYVLYANDTDTAMLRLRGFDYSNFKIRNSKFPALGWSALGGKIPFWTYTKFSREIKKDKPDILFMPIQTVPFRNKPKNIKIVVTVHDLAYLVFPNYFTNNDRKKLNYNTKRAVNMADKIIVPSEATKKDIIKYYNIQKDKIHCIHHGISPFNDKDSIESSKKGDFESKINDYKPFILFVGTIQPRKNIERLIEAFEKVKDRNEKYADLKLVIAGAKGWMSESIYNKAKKSKYSSDIVFTGGVKNDYLYELYQNALMFVLPSLYEGFGLPVLEAMSFGLPCIVSDNSALSEIVDSHALLVDAYSPDDIAQKINMFLNHENLRKDYGLRSIDNASGYKWEYSAKKLIDVFNELK